MTRDPFDRNALWLLAAPVTIVLLLISWALFLLAVIVVLVPWLVIVHEQRDRLAAENMRLAFKVVEAERHLTERELTAGIPPVLRVVPTIPTQREPDWPRIARVLDIECCASGRCEVCSPGEGGA